MGRFRKFRDSLQGTFKKKRNGNVTDDKKTLVSNGKPATPPSASTNVSSVTKIIAQQASSDVASSLPSYSLDPWTRAYEIFQDRESELAADYKKHLASLQEDPHSSSDHSTPLAVDSIVKRLLEDRERKQWQVSLLGKNMKIREQVERLAKFALWSDDIVKSALSAQPYAALAWSGVSMLLASKLFDFSALKRMLTRTASYERHQAD